MPQVYQVTYPNGKIYVGSDMAGTLTYFGSPSERAKAAILADHTECRHDFAVRKQILWESETAGKTDTLAMERKLIVETAANNPAVGYNLTPKWLPA